MDWNYRAYSRDTIAVTKYLQQTIINQILITNDEKSIPKNRIINTANRDTKDVTKIIDRLSEFIIRTIRLAVII